jgi:hypothetical protein
MRYRRGEERRNDGEVRLDVLEEVLRCFDLGHMGGGRLLEYRSIIRRSSKDGHWTMAIIDDHDLTYNTSCIVVSKKAQLEN